MRKRPSEQKETGLRGRQNRERTNTAAEESAACRDVDFLNRYGKDYSDKHYWKGDRFGPGQIRESKACAREQAFPYPLEGQASQAPVGAAHHKRQMGASE